MFMTSPFVSRASANPQYKILHRSKGREDGRVFATALLIDAQGNLYGTTSAGGKFGDGTVFELSPNPDGSWTEQLLYNFTGGSDGSSPDSSLIFDRKGNLYGSSYWGGVNNSGAVFELERRRNGTWKEKVLYSFCSLPNCADGNWPVAGVVFDKHGNLYGIASDSESSDINKIYKLTPQVSGEWQESIIHSFDSGSWLYAGLTYDGSGHLYGTTWNGGTDGAGSVFELTPHANGKWKETVLYNFIMEGQDGTNPWGTLTLDAEGNLYGTASYGGNYNNCYAGCGTVFELSPSRNGNWIEKLLYQFSYQDGYSPRGSVVFDQAGNLYGTTWHGGGVCDCGDVFKLTPNPNGPWQESVLHRFHDTPGAQPDAGPIFDQTGNLYGTTEGDQIKIFGSVYELVCASCSSGNRKPSRPSSRPFLAP
jgi:uncharacterized repeat protein (TIGR03803 family)